MSGQPDVEHDARPARCARPRPARPRRLDRHGVVPAQHERAAQGVAKGAVVVDDQDAHPAHCGGRAGVLRRFLRRSYAAPTHGRESLGMRRQRRTTIIVVGGALAIASVGYGLGTQAGDGTAIADNTATEQDGSGAERGGRRRCRSSAARRRASAPWRTSSAWARPSSLNALRDYHDQHEADRRDEFAAEAREGARHLHREGERARSRGSMPTARTGSRRSSRARSAWTPRR